MSQLPQLTELQKRLIKLFERFNLEKWQMVAFLKVLFEEEGRQQKLAEFLESPEAEGLNEDDLLDAMIKTIYEG